jgi:hypothetical protein
VPLRALATIYFRLYVSSESSSEAASCMLHAAPGGASRWSGWPSCLHTQTAACSLSFPTVPPKVSWDAQQLDSIALLSRRRLTRRRDFAAARVVLPGFLAQFLDQYNR